MQLLTAAERPRGLRAIVPSSVVFDLYRDVAYAGRDREHRVRRAVHRAAEAAGPAGDAARRRRGRRASARRTTPRHEAREPGHRAAAGRRRRTATRSSAASRTRRAARATTAARIDVPVLTSIYWQDEQTGSRVGGLLERGRAAAHARPGRTWALLVERQPRLQRVQPGLPRPAWSASSRTSSAARTTASSGRRRSRSCTRRRSPTGGRRGRRASTRCRAPEPLALHLRGDGRLGLDAGRAAASGRFRAPLPSPSTNPLPFERDRRRGLWRAPAPAGGPRGVDLAAAGRGPRGARLGVARPARRRGRRRRRPAGDDHRGARRRAGALRAARLAARVAARARRRRARRRRGRCTRCRAADVAPVDAGRAVRRARSRCFPFGHTFRRGSAIRVVVDSPAGTTGNWGFSFDPTPQTDPDPRRGSKLVLGRVPGGARAQAARVRRPALAAVPASHRAGARRGAPAARARRRRRGRAAATARRCASRRGVTITFPRVRRGDRLRRVTVTFNGRRATAGSARAACASRSPAGRARRSPCASAAARRAGGRSARRGATGSAGAARLQRSHELGDELGQHRRHPAALERPAAAVRAVALAHDPLDLARAPARRRAGGRARAPAQPPPAPAAAPRRTRSSRAARRARRGSTTPRARPGPRRRAGWRPRAARARG